MVLIWERWQAGKCPNKKWRFEWENPWARWEIFKQPPCLITRGFAANGRWMLPKKYNESGLLFKQWISRSEDHEIARDFSSYWFYHEHMWILPLKLYVYIYILDIMMVLIITVIITTYYDFGVFERDAAKIKMAIE